MGLMELLERFVVAVEVIAASKQEKKVEIVAATFAGEPNAKPAPEKAPEQAPPATVEQQAKKDSEALNRELIKKELRERGIDFKPAALTTTLVKLLEGAKKVGVGPVATEGTPEVVPPADAKAPAATKDQAREALAKLSGSKGLDEAMEVLKVQGLATKLSEVDPSRYMLIVDTCRVRAGVAANA